MRRLVTIRQISELNPIPDADNIEVATIDGWEVVVRKGDYTVGDYGVYFEIDSGLPAYDSRYSFLLKNGTKNFFGKEVLRIKTIRLRKQISQGMFLTISSFPEILNYLALNKISIDTAVEESIDFSEMLDVVKYEPPAPSAPNAAGTFPSFIFKTDVERIQNIFRKMNAQYQDTEFYATLKMNGVSGTYAYTTNPVYHHSKLETDSDGGQFIVCSRNLLLKNVDSQWHEAAKNLDILKKLKEFHFRTGRNIAIQGELLGKGIQKTIEGFIDYTLRGFVVFDIDRSKRLPIKESIEIFNELNIPMVDIIDVFKPFKRFATVKEFIEFSDSLPPKYAKIPEGIVYHSSDDGDLSFKVISNKYLLKNSIDD